MFFFFSGKHKQLNKLQRAMFYISFFKINLNV